MRSVNPLLPAPAGTFYSEAGNMRQQKNFFFTTTATLSLINLNQRLFHLFERDLRLTLSTGSSLRAAPHLLSAPPGKF